MMAFCSRAMMALSAAATVAAMLLASTLSAQAETRVALVIGNSDYASVPRLPNPVNDASAIGLTLSRLDFEVTVKTNLGKSDLERQLVDFSDKARDADIAVVFYAGHGMEMGGENYLIPIDATLKSDNRVKFETVSLNDVLSTIEGGKGLKLVLLDACRDNPFATAMAGRKTRSVKRGLARVDDTPGVYVSYAAAAGTTAEDGDTGHSPYTEALLANLEQPGVELNFLFRKVAAYVQQKTGGRQTPFEYGRLPDSSIFLKPPVEVPIVVPLAADPCRDAAAHWAAIEDKNERALFEDHLKRFGACAFSTLAQNAIDRQTAAENDVAAGSNPVERKALPETAMLTDDAVAAALAKESTSDPLADVVPEHTIDEKDLARQIQTQLNRVGCTVGDPDGDWGPRSIRALEKFSRLGGSHLAANTPSESALTALKDATGIVCPIQCGPLQVASGNQCIAKACTAGKVLSAKGMCVKPATKPAEVVRKKVRQRIEPKTVERRERKQQVVVERRISTSDPRKGDPLGRKCESVRHCFD